VRFIPLIPLELKVSQKGLKRGELKSLKLSSKGKNQELFYAILLNNLKSLKDNKKTLLKFIETLPEKEALTIKMEDAIKKRVTPFKDKLVKKENIPPLKGVLGLKDNQKIANLSDINGLKTGEIALFLWKDIKIESIPLKEKNIKTSKGILRNRNITILVSNFRRGTIKGTFPQIQKLGKGNILTSKKDKREIKNSLPLAGKPKNASYLKSYKKHLPNQRLEDLLLPQIGKGKEVEVKNLVAKNSFTKGESISLDKDKKSNNNTQALSFFDSVDRFYEHIRNLKKVFAIKKVTKIDSKSQNTKIFSIKIPLEEKTILQIRMVKDNFYAKILTSNDKVNIIMQNLNQLTQQIANLGFSKTVVSVQSFTGSGSSFKQDSQRSNRDDNKHNNNGGKLERVTENSNRISFSFYL